MKNYLFLIVLLLFSCKKNDTKQKIMPKDELLDLQYEVLNQLVKSDSMTSDFNHFIYSSTLSPVNIGVEDNEVSPLGIDLKYDSIFSQKDSVFYKNQERNVLNFKFDKSRINSDLKYINGQELHQLGNKKSDFWTEFDKKYGDKCIRRFSVPFFNKDKTMCIIENSSSCGFLNAFGSTSIYKKVNGKWIIVKTFDEWVS
ncbi:hypothetical protein [Chryseobacterium chendengshani]|uniref:hypothetical protein n=1 Tax=Chryseobacterium sp. LJ756 TaxID=2864113 RepID=UPI001C6429D4|nr:hypothetical protein [Chryseobacterium sp. LJ756]MBW7675149.1 hypothetical protein [Chryseobacterium sp. LJ756]